jgi:hypothetical protein
LPQWPTTHRRGLAAPCDYLRYPDTNIAHDRWACGSEASASAVEICSKEILGPRGTERTHAPHPRWRATGRAAVKGALAPYSAVLCPCGCPSTGSGAALSMAAGRCRDEGCHPSPRRLQRGSNKRLVEAIEELPIDDSKSGYLELDSKTGSHYMPSSPTFSPGFAHLSKKGQKCM